jgi:hypothetical protein
VVVWRTLPRNFGGWNLRQQYWAQARRRAGAAALAPAGCGGTRRRPLRAKIDPWYDQGRFDQISKTQLQTDRFVLDSNFMDFLFRERYISPPTNFASPPHPTLIPSASRYQSQTTPFPCNQPHKPSNCTPPTHASSLS